MRALRKRLGVLVLALTTVVCPDNVYRSRFHPEYIMPVEVERFWERYNQHESPETAEQKLAWFLGWLNVGLPYRMKGGSGPPERKRLMEALQMRRDPARLREIWTSDATHQLIVHGPYWAERLQHQLLRNVMGHAQELENNCPDRLTSECRDPAWRSILKAAHRRLALVYRHAPLDSVLFTHLHTQPALHSLVRLLQSPDARERRTVTRTLIRILRKLMQGASNESLGSRTSAGQALQTLLQTIQTFMQTIGDEPTPARLRAVAPLLHLHLTGVTQSGRLPALSQRRHQLIHSVISHLNGPLYAIASNALDHSMALLMSHLKEGTADDWTSGSALLIHTIIPTHPVDQDHDKHANTLRLSLLVRTFIDDNISPHCHADILGTLVRHTAVHCGLMTKLMVLSSIGTPEFLARIVAQDPTLDLHKATLTALFVTLARWAAGELPPVRVKPESQNVTAMVRNRIVSLLEELFVIFAELGPIVQEDEECHRLYDRLSRDGNKVLGDTVITPLAPLQ